MGQRTGNSANPSASIVIHVGETMSRRKQSLSAAELAVARCAVVAMVAWSACLVAGCGSKSSSGVQVVAHGDVVADGDAVTTTGATADSSGSSSPTRTYSVIDTGVVAFYDDKGEVGSGQSQGEAFFGQDAHHVSNKAVYTDNGDGTITDEVTGLIWQKNMGKMVTHADALANASQVKTGGHADWRLPTIKELYSLIIYTGRCKGPDVITPFIDTKYFDQPLGDTSDGGREIDAQTWSATKYLGITMHKDTAAFGVNFLDGRVKGYPMQKGGKGAYLLKYARYVRGNPSYGVNKFVDNSDETVGDQATGLMWQKKDDGKARDWKGALGYCQDLALAGHLDWRLPDAKELASIVDYSRSPQDEGGNSAAIDPVFGISQTKDPEGGDFFPYFWTSTTLLDGPSPGKAAVYVTFGRALGYLGQGNNQSLRDAHGAGAIRSDPKSGNAADYPGHVSGFQGDVQYVYNHVRCVRDLDGLGGGSGSGGGTGGGVDAGAGGGVDAGGGGGGGSSGGGGGGGGSASCTTDADCKGKCNGAQGCTCDQPPNRQQKICVPTCKQSSDCPHANMTCNAKGICVPGQGGGKGG